MLSEDYSLATRDGFRPIVSVLIMSDENLQHYLMCCDDHAAEWTTLTLAIQTLAAPSALDNVVFLNEHWKVRKETPLSLISFFSYTELENL